MRVFAQQQINAGRYWEIVMFDNRDPNWNDKLSAPVPINIHINGYFVSLLKGDVEVIKVNNEDQETIYNVIKLLNGLIRADVVMGEIEQIRDLLQEMAGS